MKLKASLRFYTTTTSEQRTKKNPRKAAERRLFWCKKYIFLGNSGGIRWIYVCFRVNIHLQKAKEK